MANRARGEVALALGGKTFVLRPSFGVVCEIEDAVGASLFEIGRKLERVDITARELVGVAHACLEHCGYPFERAELGELIVRDGTRATLVALVEFCRNYAFGGREKKKTRTRPRRRRRGQCRGTTSRLHEGCPWAPGLGACRVLGGDTP